MPRDDRLPFLDTAWSAAAATRFFNEQVLPRLRPTERVRAVRQERMSYRPGRDCVMLYALSPEPSAASGDTTLPRWAVVSFGADGRFEEVYRRHYGTRPGDGAAASATFVRGHDALVELFPRDWKLPGLAAATDMRRMAPVLARAAGGTADPGSWRHAVLRYHPATRCVIRYEREGADAAGARTIGKLHANPAKSARGWAVLRTLADSGIYGGAWRVPRPVAHLPELDLVLMGYEPGTPLRDLVCDEPESSRTDYYLTSAARMLAALHALPGGSSEPRTAGDEGADVLRSAEEMAGVAPGLARRITTLLERIRARLVRFPVGRTGFLHGCCTPNQLLVDGERLAVIDFDAACHGDPAIDLGTFVGTMHKYGSKHRDRRTVDRSAELFLEAYRRAAPDAGVVQRARLIACQDLLRYASRSVLRTAYRWDDPDRAARPTRFIDAAEACLAKL